MLQLSVNFKLWCGIWLSTYNYDVAIVKAPNNHDSNYHDIIGLYKSPTVSAPYLNTPIPYLIPPSTPQPLANRDPGRSNPRIWDFIGNRVFWSRNIQNYSHPWLLSFNIKGISRRILKYCMVAGKHASNNCWWTTIHKTIETFLQPA